MQMPPVFCVKYFRHDVFSYTEFNHEVLFGGNVLI